MARTSAEAQIEVPVDPMTAFTAFTEEIDRWWVPGPINSWSFARSKGKRIEPGVGGRLLELYEDDVLELGRITIWEPGARLSYRSLVDDTEVDIWFEPSATGTLVKVEHKVLPGADVDKAALFFPNVIRWLENWVRVRDVTPGARRLARLAIGLHYQDPAAAARWLHAVFGLTSWDRIPAEGESQQWIELNVGNVSVLLFERKDDDRPGAHTVWVYVDDLEAHFAHAGANGAKLLSEIHEHGYRYYDAEDFEGHRWTFVQKGPLVD